MCVSVSLTNYIGIPRHTQKVFINSGIPKAKNEKLSKHSSTIEWIDKCGISILILCNGILYSN